MHPAWHETPCSYIRPPWPQQATARRGLRPSEWRHSAMQTVIANGSIIELKSVIFLAAGIAYGSRFQAAKRFGFHLFLSLYDWRMCMAYIRLCLSDQCRDGLHTMVDNSEPCIACTASACLRKWPALSSKYCRAIFTGSYSSSIVQYYRRRHATLQF